MQAIVDHLLTTYEKAGNGKTILLLHGWGDSASTFKSLVASLEGDYKLLSLNLPGFGGSQAPGVVWGLEDYSKFVASWLKKIDEKNVFAVIGHSNGGAIAIRAISSGEIKVEKLILLASAGIRGEGGKSRIVKTAAVKVGKFASTPLPARLKSKLKIKVYEASGSEALLFPELEDTFKKIISHDVREEASGLKVPTLLIYGTADTATPPRHGQLLAEAIKQSKLEVIVGAGHFVHHDAHQEVEMAVKEFLSE